jgi:hypothetical protein
MRRKTVLLALTCLLGVPVIIYASVTAAFATNQLCVDDLGRWYLPTYGFGCRTPQLLLQTDTLYGNFTFKFVLNNPASITIPIEGLTIINHGYAASSTMISHPTQVVTVNDTVTTYPAYTEASYSWTNANTSLECMGGAASFVPIASNSVQTESCIFSSSQLHMIY